MSLGAPGSGSAGPSRLRVAGRAAVARLQRPGMLLTLLAVVCVALWYATREVEEDWNFHMDLRDGPQHGYVTELELRSAHHLLWRVGGKDPGGADLTFCCESIGLTTERPETMHVRWCDQTSKRCRIDDVDFRGRLPSDLRFKSIYPVFVDGRMSVYLVEQKVEEDPGKPESRAPRWMYGTGLVHVLIYPPAGRH